MREGTILSSIARGKAKLEVLMQVKRHLTGGHLSHRCGGGPNQLHDRSALSSLS